MAAKTSGSSWRSAKNWAFLSSYAVLSWKTCCMEGDMKQYAFPDIPWHNPKPFFKTPYFQTWFKLTYKTYLSPIEIAISGNIYVNLAKAVITPGAPWQKWTNLVELVFALYEKLPLIKCFIRKIIQALKMLIMCIVSAPKSFNFIEDSRMLRFPASPWAPPKYSFLWKW